MDPGHEILPNLNNGAETNKHTCQGASRQTAKFTSCEKRKERNSRSGVNEKIPRLGAELNRRTEVCDPSTNARSFPQQRHSFAVSEGPRSECASKPFASHGRNKCCGKESIHLRSERKGNDCTRGTVASNEMNRGHSNREINSPTSRYEIKD